MTVRPSWADGSPVGPRALGPRDVIAITPYNGQVGQLRHTLDDAGLVDVDIRETHRVHKAAASAIVRAAKPDPACCDTDAQATCCEPAVKSECCDSTATAAGGCGCGSL